MNILTQNGFTAEQIAVIQSLTQEQLEVVSAMRVVQPYSLEFIGVSYPEWESLCLSYGNLINENNELYIGREDLEDLEVSNGDDIETVNLARKYGCKSDFVCFYR